jgi:hypothetical protein
VTTAIKDLAGNSLATSWWQFTTNNEPTISNIYYSVNGTDYFEVNDSAAGIPQNITRLRLKFDRHMNPGKQWLEIFEGSSSPSPLIPESHSWSDSNTTITYSLTGHLKSATAYQAKLFGWGGTFEDTDGNTLSKSAKVGDGIWNFTAVTDTTAPVLSSTFPAAGTTGVGRNIARLVLRFNEPMNATRASAITFTPAVGSFSMNRTWVEGSKTCIIAIPQLAASTAYTVNLGTGTSSFQDPAGNNINGSFTFTTGTSTAANTMYIENFEEYSAPNFSIFRNVITDCLDCNWLRTSPSSEKAETAQVWLQRRTAAPITPRVPHGNGCPMNTAILM